MPKITPKTRISTILKEKPQALDVMLRYGLYCACCPCAANESLEQGAKAHGLSKEDIAMLIKEINKKSKK